MGQTQTRAGIWQNYSWADVVIPAGQNYKDCQWLIIKEVGEKFERKKVRIAEKVELFSSQTFFLQFLLGSYRDGATEMADHSFES